MAEHYNLAILPARVRKPKDKPNVEGSVGKISTWITAALRNEQFFSLAELNASIREKLDAYNARKFQKKECSRLSLFLGEEMPLLAPLPATPFELAEWKQATVQFNYHIAVDRMFYSVPYQYIKNKVDVRITDTTVEIFYNHNRIRGSADILNVCRMVTQGLGYSGRAVFSGVMEMLARTIVCLGFVGVFGFTAICFADQAAWLAACCYIAPTCLYCVKKSTKMIADRGAK